MVPKNTDKGWNGKNWSKKAKNKPGNKNSEKNKAGDNDLCWEEWAEVIIFPNPTLYNLTLSVNPGQIFPNTSVSFQVQMVFPNTSKSFQLTTETNMILRNKKLQNVNFLIFFPNSHLPNKCFGIPIFRLIDCQTFLAECFCVLVALPNTRNRKLPNGEIAEGCRGIAYTRYAYAECKDPRWGYKCKCFKGYIGDGVNCKADNYITPAPVDQCVAANCWPYATCITVSNIRTQDQTSHFFVRQPMSMLHTVTCSPYNVSSI